MPSSISFFPAAAPASAPSAPSPDQTSSGETDVSFDSVLNQTAPPSEKSGPRTAAGGPARANAKTGKAAATENVEKTPAGLTSGPAPTTTASDPALLSPEELAAMLALIGAPVALQPPPPPAEFSITGDTRVPASTEEEAGIECESALSTLPSATRKDREASVADATGAEKPTTKATFTLDAAASSEAGTTARDLLKQGAEVIDYQLQPAPAESVTPTPTAAPGTTAAAVVAAVVPKQTIAAANVTDAPAAADSAVQAATFAQQASPSPAQPVDVAPQRRFVASKSSLKAGPEKIAAAPDSRESAPASGVKSSIVADKNNFLTVDHKPIKSEELSVGTNAANWGDSMNPDARSTPFVARLIDGALSLLGTSSAGAATMERSMETPSTPAASAAQAAQIVTEIRDIADGLWAVERNSVEVRFHYSEHERLSVKVEYRDGVVRTTFRTDSPELRDTIAREWQSQVASASDARPYRVADPVFNTPPADARGFSLGGDSSRQQRQAEQSGNAPHTFAATSGRGPSSSSAAAAPAPALTRPDTALHLHAFA